MENAPEAPAPADYSALIARLDRMNELLRRDVASRESWRLAARNGLFAALGGVLGTGLVLSLVAYFLKPLENISALRPALDTLSQQLNRAQPNSK